MNGQLLHTINEFGNDWTAPFWPVDIETATEWTADRGGLEADATVVLSATVTDETGDIRRPATVEELTVIQRFIYASESWNEYLDGLCLEEYEDMTNGTCVDSRVG